MDFELEDYQLEFQRVAREVVEQECPPSLVRAVVDGRDDGGGFWKTLVDLDWPSMTVPDEDGGMGLSPVELVIILEELGAVADPSPFLATTSQYVALVWECTTAEQRSSLLGAVCQGRTGTVAFAEHAVRAEPDGDGWRLDGVVGHVLDGDRADEIAVVAATVKGTGVFVVPGEAVPSTRTPSFDGTLHVAEVRVDGVQVPAERAFVGPDVGDRVARARQEAVTGMAAVMVGASRRILDLVLGHVKDRHQFGVPIGSFQAVKHMVVDVYVAIERARALVQFAALTIAEDDDRRALASSMAKAAAGDAQRITAKHGIQLFGGLGFTWENDLQIFVRRAKAGELLLGGTAEHRARVARTVLAAQDEQDDDGEAVA